MVDIVGTLTKAAELIEQGVELYERVRPSISNIQAPQSANLQNAQARLEGAIARANAAGSSLDRAIRERLEK